MTTMNNLFDSTMFFGGNAPFVEELYENYLNNPTSVPDEWRDYFDRLAQMPGYVARDVRLLQHLLQKTKNNLLLANWLQHTVRLVLAGQISIRSSVCRAQQLLNLNLLFMVFPILT